MTGAWIWTLVAADEDIPLHSDVLSFVTLENTAAGFLRLDALSGNVTLIGPPPNWELDQRSYFIIVDLHDNGTPQLHRVGGPVNITVTIADANDAPVFTSASVVLLEENWPPGVPFFDVTTSDEDRPARGDYSTFAIVGGNTSLYVIDSLTGSIATTRRINFEVDLDLRHTFIVVNATDSGVPPLWATAVVNFTLVDINDAPVIVSISVAGVIETQAPGVPFFVVEVEDEDGDDGVFSLLQPVPVVFAVDPITGNLSVVVTLDYETKRLYAVVVVFNETLTPELLSTSATLDVLVLDGNDAPVLVSPLLVDVKENMLPGTAVYQTRVTEEFNPFDTAIYEIVGGSFASVFTIGRVSPLLVRPAVPLAIPLACK
jgi:hypothetical protein